MDHIRGNRIRFSGNSDNDIISNLPPEILLEILDKLPTEDAMTTAILSPKWRNLWKILPRIEFSDNMQKEREKKVVGMVNKFIKHYEGNKMESFHVSLKYNTRKRKTYQSWIAFAATKNVEELHLDFHGDHRRAPPGLPPSFELPHNILNCASLVRLHLESVGLILLPAINLESLKELELVNSQLSDDATKVITKNCPKLESLVLRNCNRRRNLKITVAPQSNLSKLTIIEGYLLLSSNEISVDAPNVTKLNFLSGMWRSKYLIENVPAVTEARLSFDDMQFKVTKGIFYGEGTERKLDGLLENFQQAKVLHLCSMCIQFTDDLAANSIFVGGKYWKTKHNAFKSCLQRLAAVEFVNLWGTYQTWDAKKFDPKKFFRACQDGYDLLIFLIENSPSFERFIFTTSKKQEEFPKLLFL
ncbi:hypothetical protein RJ639_019651 [Escallonia herrerae]|uniref:F-box domain-containing protein n=1 Tax=Escallonia herrerae TaxID=1293975 RepID=A0AA89AIJ1_9ASTE|nr:hypothetical protein RJ639_019651 [Escallonia herrerae]